MASLKTIRDQLHRITLRGLDAPAVFAHYRKTGDQLAIVELLRRTGPALRSQCRPYLQDIDEIDEVVQEVFRLLVERADTIRDANGIAAWLEQTAANVARNRSRRQARGARPLAPDDLAAIDPTPGPDLIVEMREKYAHVLAEIEQLKRDWKQAL